MKSFVRRKNNEVLKITTIKGPIKFGPNMTVEDKQKIIPYLKLPFKINNKDVKPE